MPSSSTQLAPPLPPRHIPTEPLDDDEPPPAYTPSPAHDNPIIQSGPRYPFGPTHSTPSDPHHFQSSCNTAYPAQDPPHPPIQNYSAPPLHPSTQQYQPQPNYHQPPEQHQHNWTALPHPQHAHNYAAIPASSQPTSVPTPGRPLLFEDRILVYTYVNGVCYFCPKCCNTGFKGFDATRPCRKCWLKYGKPWNVVRSSPITNASMANFQRPLPPNGFASYQPPALVVRPGDPRIGGRLCLNCNGSGSKPEEISLFNVLLGGGGSEVCPSCRGTGRIF